MTQNPFSFNYTTLLQTSTYKNKKFDIKNAGFMRPAITFLNIQLSNSREEYHKSLEELITAYGTRRIHTKDSTAWINFRGCYYKNNGYHYCV
jgi:hypothetical protein